MFWSLTPRELSLMFEAAAERSKREHNNNAWLAWHVAALTRAQKFPKLKDLLHRDRSKPQTPDQMIAILRALNAAHGGEDLTKGK